MRTSPDRLRQCPAAEPVRLCDLEAGHIARLHGSDLPAQDLALLGSLGMTDQCLLRVCKIGEPCIVQVQATRIGLSRAVAAGILVVPETAG